MLLAAFNVESGTRALLIILLLLANNACCLPNGNGILTKKNTIRYIFVKIFFVGGFITGVFAFFLDFLIKS